MRRVGIVTLVGNSNYGNRLQNYALLHILEKAGYSVNSLWFVNWKTYLLELLKKIVIIFPLNKWERNKRFIRFSDKKTNVKYIVNKNRLANQFDKFVVGSDQVWNYTFKTMNENMFLKFSGSEKNVSYAASFGISSIPEDKKSLYVDGLNHIKHISVREEAGSKIVYELTGRESTVVLDPTMLLTKDEWLEIAKIPNMMTNKRYILTYFLGEMSKAQKDEINSLSGKYEYEIINMNDKNQPNYYVCGPSEFIYLFSRAEIVFTDSFHACVFSILFEKPFFVFDRNSKGVANMNSRLDTLLSTFQLEKHKIESINCIENVFDIDYTETTKILEAERARSIIWLKNSLED